MSLKEYFEMLAKNKSGWYLIEYFNIREEDIGYIDEIDVKIVQMVFPI